MSCRPLTASSPAEQQGADSDPVCLDATNQNWRGKTSREVTFTIHNPEARLSQRAIEAIARLLLADEAEQLDAQQGGVAA